MIDSQGKMYIEDNDIIELMLANRQAKILPRNKSTYQNFESQCRAYGFDVPFKVLDDTDNIEWNMTEEFKQLNIREYILQQHQLTNEQINRVDLELNEFYQRDLVDLLRFLAYLVSILRSNNIVYGVGRGSSIASYVLYLLGVHRIDSFKFNLDIKEFLK